MSELAQVGMDLPSGEEVAVVGFRNAKGEQTAETSILDEALLSVLVSSGVPIVAFSAKEDGGGQSSENRVWSDDAPVPPEAWRDVSAPWVLGGRVQNDSAWSYVRLFAVAREAATVAGSRSRRILREDLERQVEAERREEIVVAPAEFRVSARLRLLGLRREGGFDQQLTIAANHQLEPADRLQIRFDVDADCWAWAFLYSSEGRTNSLFSRRLVYAGTEQFGPSEQGWVRQLESGSVYTLYFIVARTLEEDDTDLFVSMKKLILRNVVDRYEGLNQLDRAIADYVESGAEGVGEVLVIRSVEEENLEKLKRVVLDDGLTLEVRAEKLGPSKAIVRAVSFEVF